MRGTIPDAIARRAESAPESIAIEARGRCALTNGALHAHLRDVVSRLNALGVGRGDRVGIVLPNSPEAATACVAVMACATAVPINPDYRFAEYETAIARLGIRCLLTMAGGQHPARAAAAAANLPILEVVSTVDGPVGTFELRGSRPDEPTRSAGLAKIDDVALVLQTSGTTALPKVVPLTHGNLAASAENVARSLQLRADDRCLHFLPMFHIGGIVDVLAAPLLAGGSVICAKSFSAADFFRDVDAFRPTWTQAVPVMIQEMLDTRDAFAESGAVRRLRLVRSVSAPLPTATKSAFEQAFGVPIVEIYGMSETAGVITSNPLPPAKRPHGSVGLPAGPEVRILDPDGRALPPGETGEVAIRGANVMAGYEGSGEVDAAVFHEGWFRSGDLGYFDADGYLYLSGRLKDMVNRGGEKVSPHEVDQVLLAHPTVADAATFAVPHPSLGEDVAAAVVLKPGATVSRDDLGSYLRERLAFFKIPRIIHFVERIPRGANGKLQRATLSKTLGGESVAAASGPGFVAPQSPVARMLAEIWSKILKSDAIGANDDFFALGGSSLKAASFINELQQRWGDTVYVSSVFDAPTIAKYEQYLRQHYPEVIARMVGEYVAPRQQSIAKVTPAMVEQLKAAIAHPLSPSLRTATRKNRRAIFVLSPPRSGSTLLRAMLAGHPRLFAPPELYLLSYDNLADRKRWFSGSHRSQLEGNIRALMQARNQSAEEAQALVNRLEERACPTQEYYAMLQEWLGDRILVDKTPAYAVDPETLQRAEDYFEDAFYIHLLRHPYAMIRSFEEAKLDQLWYPRLVGTDSGSLDAFPFARRQLAEMIWLILNQNIVAFLKGVAAKRQFQLRFEDVVSDPQPAMEALCVALGLEFAPAMLNPQDDKKQRMTDGLHDVSRMIGDPKFHQFKRIEASVADQWKQAYETDFLSDAALQLAQTLGYRETVAEVRGRDEIEL